MGLLVISLLGAFQTTRDSSPLKGFESLKARALLAYLAVESDRPHARDALAALLWPDFAQEAAHNNLRNTLSNIRRAIGDRDASPPYLFINRETVQFNCDSDVCLDVANLIHQASGLQRPPVRDAQVDVQSRIAAVNGYRGPFLEGLSIPDSAAFEEWVSQWRERLERLTLEGLRWLARYYETREDYAAALEFARRQVILEPWMEEGHCQIMRLLALSGLREQALRQYHMLRELLSKDLQAEPAESTVRLYQDILFGGFLIVPPKPAFAHNLPVQTTSFIGRDQEIESLKSIIESGKTRLVTVTGAGGTGKTRLALRVSEELFEAFPQGIWLVELAALADPALVPDAVASALNLREVADRTILQVLLDFLRSKRLLILLDTCEHLVESTARLVDCILRSAQQVVILATSREILGVGGEMPFLCPSLALPEDPVAARDVEITAYQALVSCEAVRLFIERSQMASPTFALTQKNAPIVAQVCRRLDGIPLAIELAAARMRMLSVEQIAGRLDQAFHLLTGGSRTVLPRQQTLRAMIDWSYNLLTSPERALLLRLSIFIGGWTLEAAEAVCVGDECGSENLLPEEILDLLSRLADKSLILVELGQTGEPRYRMLDTVRQYARDRLIESGGSPAIHERHLAYYCQLAEQAETHLRAWGMMEWLNRLQAELGNLRLALEWSLTGAMEQGLRLGAALHYFWHIRSRRFEGAQWLERLLDAEAVDATDRRLSPSRRIARGKALIVAADLNHYYPGFHAEHAQQQFKEGLAVFLELGDEAKSYLPFALSHTVDTEEKLRNCLVIAREAGDEFHAAECLSGIVYGLTCQGDFDQAAACGKENLALRQKLGDADGEAFAYMQLAELEFLQGNQRRAVELYEASQRCFWAVENKEFTLYFSGFPARLAISQGDYRRAIELSETQLAAGLENSSSLVVTEALGHAGRAAWALKEEDAFIQKCTERLGAGWETNLPCGRGTIFYAFGRIALSRGDYALSRDYLVHFSNMQFAECYLTLQTLGILACATQQTQKAAVIFGALERWCGWLKYFISPAENAAYQQALETVQASLGSMVFESAWAEGAAMTREQTMELANSF